LSFDIAKAFVFGEMEDEELVELASESVSEVLNVTLGNILNELNIIKNGGKVEISTPLPMTGTMNIKRKKNGQMFVVNLKYKDSIIVLSYFI
jgi:CheY-specific phosphatase CheX